jgi:hypothetical protein
VPTVGSLAWALVADSTRFSAGTAAARKNVRGLHTELVSLKGVTSGLTSVMGALGLAVGAAGAANAMRSLWTESMATIDAAADLSDRLGVATETLTGLGYAASLNGSSAEALNESLDTVSKTIGTLNERGGRNVEVLARMGVDVAKLAELAPDQMFLELADAMAKLGSAQERAALAGFLKLGPEMVNVLSLGRAELEANIAAAEELGIAYSRFDAQKIKAANDAWERTGAAMKGAANEASIAFAPIFEGLAMAAQDALNIGKFIRGSGTSAVNAGLPRIVRPTTQAERDEEFEKRQEAAAAATAATEAAEAAAAAEELQREEERRIQKEESQRAMEAKRSADEFERARTREADSLKRLGESTFTEAERFGKEFSDIIDIANTQAGFENPAVIQRAFEDLQDRIRSRMGGQEITGNQSTAAIRAGSIEALRAQFSGNVPQKQLKEAEKQTKELEIMSGLMETISEKIQGLAEAPG